MRSYLIHMVLLFAVPTLGFSQLAPLLDQHRVNGLAINPAYAGSLDALSIELHSRKQWVGFEGAPMTLNLSLHSPLRNRKVNLGIIILSDRYGSYRENGFLLNYAYRMELGVGKLAFGLAAGLTGLSADLDALRIIDGGDPLVQDPGKKAYLPEFSAGTYYHTERFYLGFSMPLFLSHPTQEGNGKFGIAFKPGEVNYILVGGYIFRVSDQLEIMPAALLRSSPVNNTQLDLNATVIYGKKFWLGTTLRTSGNLSALIQVQVNQQFRVGYSYGYEISQLSNYQSGSHEVMLSYSFSYMLDVVGPRYF